MSLPRNAAANCLATALLVLALAAPAIGLVDGQARKPSPAEVQEILTQGNARFAAGESVHPHADAARLAQAGTEDQGDHALATVITCSDSRVPVEILFDAGIMDIFVIRVAGNVVRTDEAGSIEYGMAHVHTPLMVVLGHTQCGAVTAVTNDMQGHGHPLERNIPPLVAPIRPAVQAAMDAHPDLAHGPEIIPLAIEENVRQAIHDLFHKSPVARKLHKSGQSLVVGAIYDVATGLVQWMPKEMSDAILVQVEQDPTRAMNAMAQ